MAVEPSLNQAVPQRRAGALGYPRNVYLLLLFTLGKGFQLTIVALTTPLYVLSLGYSSEVIGLVTAVPAVGALLSGVPIGWLADRFGRKPVLVVSGLLNPIAIAGIAFATSVPLLVAASLINGILAGGYWVTNLPVLTESTRENQRVGVLALNSFLLLGVGALGSLVGGFVPELVGHALGIPPISPLPLRCGILAAASLVFLTGLPLLLMTDLPRRPRKVAPALVPPPGDALGSGAEAASVAPAAAPQATGEVRDPVGRAATAALFVKLLIPDVLNTTGQGAVVVLLPVYLTRRFGVHPGTLGVLLTVAGLIGGGVSLLSPRVVRRFGSLPTAVAAQALSLPIIGVIGFAPLYPLAAAGEFGRNVVRGFFEPVYASFTMGSVSSRLRGTLSGFYSTTWSIGFTLGPLIAGYLQARVGLSAPFVVGMVCVGSAATLLRLFFGGRRARDLSPNFSPGKSGE
jgi:MFS family permease